MIPSNILEQFPIVFQALNIGFFQTMKLFMVTLLGALPLGLIISFGSMSKFKPLSSLIKVIVWIVRGSPLMIQLLIIYYFPGSRTCRLQLPSHRLPGFGDLVPFIFLLHLETTPQQELPALWILSPGLTPQEPVCRLATSLLLPRCDV